MSIKLDQDFPDGKPYNHVLMTEDHDLFKKGEVVWVNFWSGSSFAGSMEAGSKRRINRHVNAQEFLRHVQLLNGTYWKSGNIIVKITKFKSSSSHAGNIDIAHVECYLKDKKEPMNVKLGKLNHLGIRAQDIITSWERI